jgi:hypothetical protein
MYYIGVNMNPLQTGIFVLRTDHFDDTVAHLYEHLFIARFKKLLIEKYKIITPYGWLDGEAFSDVVFLDFGFYQNEAKQLFESYVQSDHVFTHDEIQHELKRMGAELGLKLEPKDYNQVTEELRKIDKIGFTDIKEVDPAILDTRDFKGSKIILEKAAKQSYVDYTVTAGLTDLTLEESLVFLRSLPIIYDLIDSVVYDQEAYGDTKSYPLINTQNTMGAMAIYTFQKDYFSEEKLLKNLKTAFFQFGQMNRNVFEEWLQAYLKSFVNVKNWHTLTIDYYRYTGILTSREAVVAKMTPEAVLDLFSKLTFEITKTTDEHRVICY